MDHPTSEVELGRAAAAVFLKQTINEAIDETSRLHAAINDHQPLLDTFHTIELRFGPRQNFSGVIPRPHYEYTEIARAFDGHAASYDSENTHIISTSFHKVTERRDYFQIDLRDTASPIPLLNMAQGILIISNQTMGVFSESSPSPPILSVKRLKTGLQFNLYLIPRTANDSESFCLIGTIENLIKSDQLVLEDEGSGSITDYFRRGERLQSPNAVFVPKLLKLQKTIDAKERYDLSRRFRFGGTSAHHDSNIFRRDIITSIGTQLDETVLCRNSSLKHKMGRVQEIRDLVDTVEVYYDDDMVSLSLSRGRFVSEYKIGHSFAALVAGGLVQSPAWVITLPEGIELEEMHSLRLYVSNLKLGSAGTATAVLPRGNYFSGGFDPETGAPLMQYDEGSVITTFDLYAIVVCSISSDDSGNDAYTVKEVVFWFDRIQRTLEALGIDCS
jgi:hypothetical protein